MRNNLEDKNLKFKLVEFDKYKHKGSEGKIFKSFKYTYNPYSDLCPLLLLTWINFNPSMDK